jgi:hypothetical protein
MLYLPSNKGYMMMKNELMKLVGQEASVNQSPTLRAKLVAVHNTFCTWEVVSGMYNKRNDDKVGNKFSLSHNISENCFYGV